jgi:ketosteroid isomerase-like protein
MPQENVEIARAAWEAFQKGDQETTARLIDSKLEFHGTVGGLQEGEVAHGQAQIEETFEAQDLEAWEERRLDAEEYIDAGDNVVVFLREYRRGRSSGVELEAETALIVAVRGGRVVRIQGYLDRAAALEAAGLRE